MDDKEAISIRITYDWKRLVWLLSAVLCASFLFLLQYIYDNKYDYPGIRGSGGVLDLSSAGEAQPLTILTYGWEFYPQILLEPGEFEGRSPVDVYIGQYGGFEGGSPEHSPHGRGTYRLTILLPPEQKEYALELPEIYTTSKVWVNARPVSSLGNVSEVNARPSVRTGMINFQASGMAEIVVQAADYRHYYSGLIYPPAFGTVEAVGNLLAFRFLRTCIMVTASFTIGIMYLMIGVRTGEERHRMVLFALVSFLFALHVIYPLFHVFGAGFWSYRLEDMSFYLFLLAVAALHCSLCDIDGRPRLIALGTCGAVAVLALLVPSLVISRHSLHAMMAYSIFLDAFKLILFGWFITTAVLNGNQGKTMNGLLLAGLCVIAVSLLFQAAAPVFEPVRFGWQTENAGFVFILLLAAGLWYDTVNAYAGRAALAENMRLMKKQFFLQEENYRIISNNFEEIRRMRHDLRHHLNAMKEFINQHQYGELEQYMKGFGDSAEQAVRPVLCENQPANAVLNYYQQMAGQRGVPLQMKVALPAELKLEGWNLGLLLGNLLENAIEASEKLPEDMRMIEVYSRILNGNLLLTVKNSWNGDFSASGDRIRSTKHEGFGVGLSSVQALVKKHGGQFYLTPGEKEFVVSIVLWSQV